MKCFWWQIYLLQILILWTSHHTSCISFKSWKKISSLKHVFVQKSAESQYCWRWRRKKKRRTYKEISSLHSFQISWKLFSPSLKRKRCLFSFGWIHCTSMQVKLLKMFCFTHWCDVISLCNTGVCIKIPMDINYHEIGLNSNCSSRLNFIYFSFPPAKCVCFEAWGYPEEFLSRDLS